MCIYAHNICVHVYLYMHCICVYMYVLNVYQQKWSKLQTSEKKPPARYYHTASGITGHPPQLMVVGGYGGRVLSDVWMLDVSQGSWSEVLHAHVQ